MYLRQHLLRLLLLHQLHSQHQPSLPLRGMHKPMDNVKVTVMKDGTNVRKVEATAKVVVDAMVALMRALMVAPTVVGRAVASHAKVHNPPLAAPPTRRYGQNAPRVKTGPHVLLRMRIPTPTWKPHHQWWSPLKACPSRRKSSAKDATHAMVGVMSVVHARKPNPLRA